MINESILNILTYLFCRAVYYLSCWFKFCNSLGISARISASLSSVPNKPQNTQCRLYQKQQKTYPGCNLGFNKKEKKLKFYNFTINLSVWIFDNCYYSDTITIAVLGQTAINYDLTKYCQCRSYRRLKNI